MAITVQPAAGQGSSLNILVVLLVSAVAQFLSGVDITLMCRSLTSSLSSVCSPSDIEFHFHHLAPAAFVVRHVVYKGILICRRRSENEILFVYPETSGFIGQFSVYIFDCCHKQLRRYGIS